MGLVFVLDAFAGEEGGQEYEDHRLDQAVKEIEVQAERRGQENRHQILDRKSTRLNSSHVRKSRMPSSA